jgi:hypothetical protein
VSLVYSTSEARARFSELLRLVRSGTPVLVEDHEDGTRHFLRPIAAFGGRWLRVILNVRANRKVTAFFDRRVSRESQSRQGG